MKQNLQVPKKFIAIAFLAISVGLSAQATPCSELFFSEYVEGSSNNKYLEVFNPTSSTVDLSTYKIEMYANGATAPTNTLTLSGTLAPFSVIVVKNSQATIYSGSAIIGSVTNYNGDDAVALKNGSNIIDIIGRIGTDPGTAWTSGAISTLDRTLVRKSNVSMGISVNPTSGFPTLATEWDVYPTDTSAYLGGHSSNCQTTIWDGSVWSNGNPNNLLNIIIDGDYNGVAFTSKSLTVNSGKTFTIASAIVSGDVVNNGNIIVSDGGNFIQATGSTYSGTGTFTVNKTTTSDVNKYAFWASPVSGQNVYGIYGASTPQYAMTYNTATDYYDVVSNPTTAASGVGYSIKVPAANAPVSFVGAPNNGDITIPLTLTGNNYNLVGNPYPSNLKLSVFYSLNSTNIGSTLYFWDNKSNSVTTQNNNTTVNIGYATYNAASQTWTAAPTSTQPTGDVANIGQGFIVEATGTNLSFNNSLRGSTTGSFFNKNGLNSTDKYWLKLSTPYNSHNTLAITYGGGALNSIEKNDSKLMGIGSDAFFSLVGTEKFIIQGRADFTDNDIVPLGNKQFENGNYTISLTGKEGVFNNGQAIYLHDKLLNTYTNLQNGSYTFAALQGEFTNRFEIVYKLGTLGISEVKISDVKVYKNDAEFVVESPENIQNVQILDASGRLVKDLSPNAKTLRFTLDTKGVYIVKIKMSNKDITKKIIK